MITDVQIDETHDEEVFTIDFIDGPFYGMIEAAWDIEVNEWAVAFGYVRGPDWLGEVVDLENIDCPLKMADPRFTEDLLNAPVTRWVWGEFSRTI